MVLIQALPENVGISVELENPNVVAHVGNMHAEPKVFVRQLLEGDGVVEVSCRLAVDRDPSSTFAIGSSGVTNPNPLGLTCR